MKPSFEERLRAVSWDSYFTAYGPAVNVPDQLRQLAGSNRKAALDAAHELWCGLCHQHVQVGSVATPALPFLLEVLDFADAEVTVELLDIMLGLAIGVNRQRAVAYQQSLGRAVAPEEKWVATLRATLLGQSSRFGQLAMSPNEEIANFARRILAELGLSDVCE